MGPGLRSFMPAMPRPSGKARKVAYAILGVPENIKDKQTSEQKKVNKELVFQETVRVR